VTRVNFGNPCRVIDATLVADHRQYLHACRAVFAPDPRLCTAARSPGAAAELALCSATRPAIAAQELRDGLS
jgi:hypothetical protein